MSELSNKDWYFDELYAVSTLSRERVFLDPYEQGILIDNREQQSSVAYVLGITECVPERAPVSLSVEPSRFALADIDLDFDSRYRDEMIRYTASKYGKDRVAQIITFGSIKGRAAVRDAARVLDLPYALGDQISKSMPPMISGRDTPLWACFEKTDKHQEGFDRATGIRDLYESNPDAKKVIDIALGLEDLRRSDGIHAAAVVISDAPLTDYLPIQRKVQAGQDPEDSPIVTQYEMHGVEDLGLLKMDFLGLRNLDVIEDTLKLIKEFEGVDIDILQIPLDDEETFVTLREGRSIGTFQLEGKQMRDLMKSLAPTTFDDIPALVALYRPGPMAANMHNDYADRKNGRKPISYQHEDMKEILEDTYGLMIYQEELMRVAQKIAGYSLAEADNLRKACGKKIRELIAKERDKFIPAVVANGYTQELAEDLFDIIEPFADYAFNKCLVGTTLVRSVDGDITIDQIRKQGETSLFSYADGELIEDVCVEVIDTGVQEVFLVEFSDGSSIEATLDHKFLCTDGVYYMLRDIYDRGLEIQES